jgi:ABC-type multidrug transport system ATPase subunit
MSNAGSLIELHNVCFAYPHFFLQKSHLILDSVSCTINPGHIIALHGANGAGKSTILKLIADLIRPISGKIVRLPIIISYIGHEFSLPLFLTPYQIIRYALWLRKKKHRMKKLFFI